MTDTNEESLLLQKARRGSHGAFELAVGPYMEELRLYCYRMTASMDDADDLLQETLLRAWRGLGAFSGRSSFRSWIYRIATNRSLDVLGGRAWRDPKTLSEDELLEDPSWLQPIDSDSLDWTGSDSPSERLMMEQSIGLAFLVALQRLPPKQRSALLLREVLGYSALEAAEILDMSVEALNSALQRARKVMPVTGKESITAPSEEEEILVQRLIAAFEAGDFDKLKVLFSDSALLTMPPLPMILKGYRAIAEFLENETPFSRGVFHLRALRANSMPATAVYMPDKSGSTLKFHGLMVLRITDGVIEKITSFTDPDVGIMFGLPAEISGDSRSLH